MNWALLVLFFRSGAKHSCVCVCVCARARVRACVKKCVKNSNILYLENILFLKIYSVCALLQAVTLPLSLTDNKWHHLCITWSTRDGMWEAYLDGVKRGSGENLSPWHPIKPGGVFILGQEQVCLTKSVNYNQNTRMLTCDSLLFRTLWAAVSTPHSLLWARCQICSCGHACSPPPRSTTKRPAPATSPVTSSPGASPWWKFTEVSQSIRSTLVIRDLTKQSLILHTPA